MSDVTARLSLPYILPAQAQKHVTHNEALLRLDMLVQLCVEAFGAVLPPSAPMDGQIWALGPQPSGAWIGEGSRLALWQGGGWLFIAPHPGWRAALGADLRLWSGSDWVKPDLPALGNLDGVGVNSGYDPVNRLSVAAEATLLSHEGAGHQLKINKAGAGDTASLLFQTGWSGRAEMGTAGTDDFALKVSADGDSWQTALSVDSATAIASLPQGAQIDGPVTGLAVTQSPADTTSARLLRVGAGHAQLDATLFRQGNVLGPVAQSGGVPTGALMQRGTNSNGDFIRFADGTLICSRPSLQLTFNDGASCQADWEFPAEFVAVPALTAMIDMSATTGNIAPGPDQLGAVASADSGAPSTMARLTVRRMAGAADFVSGDFVTVQAVAFGRWF